MKLYERFSDKGFHTSILTTFEIDFDAYENIALSRLRGSGCHNNLVIADQRMLTHALSGSSEPPSKAGRLYSVSGATARGVFHTKLLLQIGRRGGRLIIGSANATASGFAGNLELAGLIECDQASSSEQSLIADVWAYISRIADRSRRTIDQQLSWMEARAPWLMRAEAAQGPVPLEDGSTATFIAAGGESGIMERFIASIGDEAVKQLIVISPYWDNDLEAIKTLANRLQPQSSILLIDRDRALFPSDAFSGLKHTRLYDVGSFGNGRFIHAKLFIAQTAHSEHVLFGSANCTISALGRENFAGLNEEACLYRKVPGRAVSVSLGLKSVLSSGTFIAPGEVPAFNPNEELPFRDLMAQYPGEFECLFDKLVWHPPSSIDPKQANIELLSASEAPLPCNLRRLEASTPSKQQFELSEVSERPAFARLRFNDDRLSAPAIVSLADVLRAEIRESRGKATERAVSQLEDETEEGLWLLEVLDELEAAQIKDEQAVTAKKSRREKKDEGNAQSYSTLDYKTFVAGCKLRSEGSAIGRNSLAGTEMSFVRAYLNRVLALKSDEPDATADDDRGFQKVLDMSDELQDAEEAVERGDMRGNEAEKASETDEAKARTRKIAIKRRQNRDELTKAVKSFIDRIKERAAEEKLNSLDILRLRALLTILVAAGLPSSGTGKNDKAPLQVLPSTGAEYTWPRLCGMTLFALFGGKKPAIHTLGIEDIYDQIPDDLIECWACCFWVVQASKLVTASQPLRGLEALTENVYALSGLSPKNAMDDRIFQILVSMSDRFAARLGIEGNAVTRAHDSSIRKIG